jgi:polyphosphate kinase
MRIQLQDNVKARWLDDKLKNKYVPVSGKLVRSQVEIHRYLFKKLEDKLEEAKISLVVPENLNV